MIKGKIVSFVAGPARTPNDLRLVQKAFLDIKFCTFSRRDYTQSTAMSCDLRAQATIPPRRTSYTRTRRYVCGAVGVY